MKRAVISFVVASLVIFGVVGFGSSAGKMKPDEIGKAVGDIYLKSMTEAVNQTKNKPAAAKVRPQLQKLKDGAVRQLVELGKQRQGLSAADKGRIDSKVSAALNSTPQDIFTKFSEACNYYIGKDANNETNQLLSSFNVITQYADFDLLKKQLPEEAKRLGIK